MWFKVDDKLHSHKKAARAGEAMALWVVAGSWCADQLTDGFVPDYIAARLILNGEQMAERLVGAGLWVEDEHDGDKGWRFNDWTDYQPTRDEVESRREYERDKKRKQRRTDGGQFAPSRGVSPGDNGGTTGGSPEGVTPSRPDPTRTNKDLEPSSTSVDTLRLVDRTEPSPDFEADFWDRYPKRDGKRIGKKQAQDQWKRLSIPDRRAVVTAVGHYRDAVDDPRVFCPVKDAWRWLRDRLFDDWQDPAAHEPEGRGGTVNGAVL
jgi:hypothetical protein